MKTVVALIAAAAVAAAVFAPVGHAKYDIDVEVQTTQKQDRLVRKQACVVRALGMFVACDDVYKIDPQAWVDAGVEI